MVEHVAESRDGRFMIYDANTGSTPDDGDRRHLFRVPVDRAGARRPHIRDDARMDAGECGTDPRRVRRSGRPGAAGGRHGRPRWAERVATLAAGALPGGFPRCAAAWYRKRVTFKARGRNTRPRPVLRPPPRQRTRTVHATGGHLRARRPAAADAARLALHGLLQQRLRREPVPRRARLRRAVGQLSARHRLRPSLPPARARRPRGAAEYQDVLAGAHFLQACRASMPSRIGIWGGSYGGYLTALALARNSDVFKAGVDLHGVHDWSRLIARAVRSARRTTLREGRPRARRWHVAWQVLAGRQRRRLEVAGAADPGRRRPQRVLSPDRRSRAPARGTGTCRYEELVLPNEIHGFLRHASWLRADDGHCEFLCAHFRCCRELRRVAFPARPAHSKHGPISRTSIVAHCAAGHCCASSSASARVRQSMRK